MAPILASTIERTAAGTTAPQPANGSGWHRSTIFGDVRRVVGGEGNHLDHAHRHLEFNLVLRGRATYFLEDHHYDLCAGSLVWLLPNEHHRLLRSPDIVMWVVIVDPVLCDDELLADVGRSPLQILAAEDVIALDRLLSNLTQDSDEPTLFNAGLDYVLRSARHVSITSGEPARKRYHPAILQALAALRSSSPPVSASRLAKACGVSADYLGQLLVEQTGRGFIEWRNRTRLERFQGVYPKSGDLLTAALAAGFGSYTQFHRVFLSLIGTTPGHWARDGAAALPVSQAASCIADKPSTRMIWYPLCDVVLSDAKRWISTEFAARLVTTTVTGSEAHAIPSGLAPTDRLDDFEADFLDELQRQDENLARQLRQALDRNDLYAAFDDMLGVYGLGYHDLGNLLTLYLSLAWIAANVLPALDNPTVGALAARVRKALAETRSFEQASTTARRRAGAALIIQTMILRNAIVAASGSGSNEILTRVCNAVHRTALDTTGLDLRTVKLVGGA